MLHYHIRPTNLGGHLLGVTITVPAGEESIVAKLPKWIPGSYKIRDYSRFLSAFCAHTSHGQACLWSKQDADTWLIETGGDAVILTYDIYAYDLSVRGAYLDDQRLFFNYCCVCLDITHLSMQPRRITIESVDDWRVFTALPKENAGQENTYIADSYDMQIDCPVEAAAHYVVSDFFVGGTAHQVVFTGVLSDEYDIDTMTLHLSRICTVEMQLFGGAPLSNYLFLNYIEPKQYGGLEHRSSVAQMAAPDMMLKKGQSHDKKTIDFMGLCAHEYFHLWNIKRLRPKDFMPYDLYREQHTEMLWMFEGFTSYYDELFLRRAGVVDAQTFLNRQAANLSKVLETPGRHLLSLAESSFDAWTKLYQADAHSPNVMVSYYAKGAIFALYLDLFIRQRSLGRSSLDDVMRYLWQHYGQQQRGIDEDDVFKACVQLLDGHARDELVRVFVSGLHGYDDLPLDQLLPDFGVDYRQTAKNRCDSGIRVGVDEQKTVITFLHHDSHAAKVGISVHDEIIAIDDRHVSGLHVDSCLNQSQPGQILKLTLNRRGRVFHKSIELASPEAQQVVMKLMPETALGKSWLACWV